MILGGLLALAGYALAWHAGWIRGTLPGDLVLNVGPTIRAPELRAPADGAVRLVVLLHGVGRSSWSMWKLERLLRAHGYEVWNESYDDRRLGLLGLGADLRVRLERHLRERGDAESVKLYAVGHSMGGLVVRSCLREQTELRFEAIVMLGTPNNGAAMAEQLRDTRFFRLVLGTKAARDLAPSAGVISELGPAPPRTGTVIGSAATDEGHTDRIVGDDDGKVGVDEARLSGAAGEIVLPVSHAFLPLDRRVHRQVLHFLRHGRFE